MLSIRYCFVIEDKCNVSDVALVYIIYPQVVAALQPGVTHISTSPTLHPTCPCFCIVLPLFKTIKCDCFEIVGHVISYVFVV